jgi:hypothetical protein
MIGREYNAMEKLINECCKNRNKQFGQLTAVELLDYVGNVHGRPHIMVTVDTTPHPSFFHNGKTTKAKAKGREYEPGSGTLKSRLGTIIIGTEKPDKNTPYWNEDEHQAQLRINRSSNRTARTDKATEALTSLASDIKSGKRNISELFALMGEESED